MNEEITQTEREAKLMAVIEDIVEGGRGLIRDWTLLEDAEIALREGGPDGLARFYQARMDHAGSRATWIKATLRAQGKKTLESEYRRFMTVYLGASGQ